MPFEVRWANGYWMLFDLERYEPTRLFGLKKDANAALAKIAKTAR